MTHKILKWQCSCGAIVTSDSRQTHTMDWCPCKKVALDLEEHYSRQLGNWNDVKILEEKEVE